MGSKLALVAIALLGAACEAHFTDLRPEPLTSDFDAGFTDLGPPPAEETPLLEGAFAGRGSYSGSGSIAVVQTTGGSLELVFGDDFSVSSVPGPVVVLTVRDRIGSKIEPDLGDIDLGGLERNRGAQTYSLPSHAAGAKNAWIYCEPFGVEVARAPLMEVPE